MPRLPVLFAGHGSPMNAVDDNNFTRALKAWGHRLPRPDAVLCVSAHWYGGGTQVLSAPRPKTIHDFGGFPRELYEIEYPAPGHPALADTVRDLLPGATLSADWGLDHGAWSVLLHLFPKADVPVVQLSIDRRLPGEEHLALGERLRPLRDQGVLILGSGNIVHNLGLIRPGDPFPWALEFDRAAAQALSSGDRARLADDAKLPSARLAVPTPDHYLPLLYALGAAHAGEVPSFPVEGFDLGAISMRSVQWG